MPPPRPSAPRRATAAASAATAATDGSFTLGAWRGDRLVGAITCERDPRSKVRHIGHVIGTMVTQRPASARASAAPCSTPWSHAPAPTTSSQQLTLSVTAGNAAAVRLYESAGFTRYGTLPRAIRVGGRFHDKHLMQLNLR